ncbi:phytanoyl-CoA dioxygenase family protein [Streptomyces sp. NPDC059568]|uniref:phytanoyl-CoA dioxygenase family protein n=1 Tax=Streptomyces sp. NPDC059568 TaxID=3346868 RepID=UPI003690E823
MTGALSQEELEQYRSQGYLLRNSVFAPEEVDSLVAAAEALYRVDSPARTVERDGVTVRAVHACHTSSDVFAAVIKDPRMLLPAHQIVGTDSVYIHQSKINAKRALEGDVWQWHQDFTYWHWEDGMRAPNAVNLAILLDAATEFNGPLLLVPGSHRQGLMDPARRDSGAGPESWKNHLAADLEYTVQVKDLAELSEESGIFSATAPAGSVLLFDPQIVHGSGVNMSPIDRRMAIFSYNEVANLPVPPGDGRPKFLSSREAAPLELAAWTG